jgi:hypothetical protein
VSRRYLATALGGALRTEMTADEVAELWDATEEDLREDDADAGLITLWARSSDGLRMAPIYFRRLDEQAA